MITDGFLVMLKQLEMATVSKRLTRMSTCADRITRCADRIPKPRWWARTI